MSNDQNPNQGFDPNRHILRLQGNKEYLPAAARIAWFRSDHPDWGIVTEVVEMDQQAQYAIFRASVFNAEGRLIATGTKREDARGFPDYLEKAECVPIDTQILTLQGWKTEEQLKVGETVLSFNVETQGMEWVPLLGTARYSDAPVFRYTSDNGVDVSCTIEHTWPTASGKLIPFAQSHTADSFVCAAPAPEAPTVNTQVTKRDAQLLGWLLARGRILNVRGRKKIELYLTADAHQEAFIRLWAHEFGVPMDKFSKLVRRVNVPLWIYEELIVKLGVMHYPESLQAIPSLSLECQNALREELMFLRGRKDGGFNTSEPSAASEALVLLTALQGKRVSYLQKNGRISTFHRVMGRPRMTSRRLDVEELGKMPVWCPKTPNGTWVARFASGTTTITGNTGSVSRALSMVGYGTLQAIDMDEGTERITDSPQPAPAPRQQAAAPRPQVGQAAPAQRQQYAGNGGGGGGGYPATPAQLGLLERMGVAFHQGITKAEASALIEANKGGGQARGTRTAPPPPPPGEGRPVRQARPPEPEQDEWPVETGDIPDPFE